MKRERVAVTSRRNRKGFDDLAAHIAKVRGLASVPESAAPSLGRAVSADTKANAAKGIDPRGNLWRRSKEGRAVLKNAAGAIDVRVARGAILITLTGRHARHHLGYVRGSGTKAERARQIIPVDDIPDSTAKVLERATLDAFNKAMS